MRLLGLPGRIVIPNSDFQNFISSDAPALNNTCSYRHIFTSTDAKGGDKGTTQPLSDE